MDHSKLAFSAESVHSFKSYKDRATVTEYSAENYAKFPIVRENAERGIRIRSKIARPKGKTEIVGDAPDTIP